MLNGDKTDPRGIFVQRSLAYVIRSSRLQEPGFLGEVQQAVWSVNPNLPLARVRTMLQVYNESMAQTQFVLVILGIAASVTLLLGLVGIYGVIAYIVSQRRREVGIRMALGAQSESVQRIFVTRGLSLAADRSGARPDRRRGADAAAVVVAVRRESVRSADLHRGDGGTRLGGVDRDVAAGAPGDAHRSDAGAAG